MSPRTARTIPHALINTRSRTWPHSPPSTYQQSVTSVFRIGNDFFELAVVRSVLHLGLIGGQHVLLPPLLLALEQPLLLHRLEEAREGREAVVALVEVGFLADHR